MQVFKLYFKLLRSETLALLIYAGVFATLLFLQASNQPKELAGFQQEKIDTALVNYDEDNVFTQGLVKYLEGYCNFVDLGYKESDLADGLFFRRVEYILTIPYDFGEEFLSGKNVKVEKKSVPDGIYSTTVDQAINNYFNTARVYRKAMPDITAEELVANVTRDLNRKTSVEILKSTKNVSNYNYYNFYYNSGSYILLTACLLGVSMIMLTFQNVNIRRRNLVAPITFRNLNIQLIAANLIFVLGYDVFLILFGYIINPDKVIDTTVVLFWINTIVFSISALAISYISAMLIRSKQANSAVSIVLPLGLSFISGAFVPQILLNDTVLKVGSFAPTFWYIKANDTIAGLNSLNMETVKPIFYQMLVQLGFAAALFALSLVISKSKLQKEY